MTTKMPPALTSQWRAWLLASRVPTLPAAIAPVIVGTATAISLGSFRLAPFLAAMFAAVLIQIGTNLANDYFDFRKGADTAERLGPTRVTQSGLISPERVRLGMLLTFALSAMIGVYLIFVGGWPILVIGVCSIAAGVLYTGGPWPLGYNGLGDLFVFIFFGLVAVAGTTYLHTGNWPFAAFFNALPVGMLITAILVVNNLRDIETDRAAGKRTLAVILGRRNTQIEFAALVIGAYLLLPLGWLLGVLDIWFWLPALTLTLAMPLLRLIFTQTGPALNPGLRDTARLNLWFSLLLSASLLV